MSSSQNTASPRPPRAKHQHSKSANQPPPNHNGNKSQRRQKGNRANNGNPATAQYNGADVPANRPTNVQDPSFTDSAVVSSEEVAIPSGPRNPKKHTQSQPSADRLFSPTAVATSSLTDTELGLTNPVATPAKVQAAYAGPTFHASPAPSALPIPKFLSKSVPAKTRSGPPTPPPEDGSDSGSSPSPSPSRAPILVPSRHQDSPLDMLFKADRAERARNANCSPASASFSSPNQPSGDGRPHHVKQDSYNSLNAPFPIELDGDSKNLRTSPPTASPITHRSVTAPSKIPQVEDSGKPNDESGAIQDLLNRLSMSQKKPTNSTPPRTVEHMPSDPSLRNHTPSPFNDGKSPFRSASGPTTPAPAAQETPDFFYGNRNLSPLFKAAKNDTSKRNSGLRTEITADSPIMPQGGFPQMPSTRIDTNASPRGVLGTVLNGPVSPRRGSAPQIQPIPPYRGMPNQHQARGGRRSYRPRPDSYPHVNTNGTTNDSTNGTPATLQKSSTAMAFIPSSVRAKPQAVTPPKKSATDTLALEQDLKRMLNLKSGDTTGVR